MIRLEYRYRRRYLDGSAGIVVSSGPALVRRSDRVAYVVDYVWGGPNFVDPVVGRRGQTIARIVRPPMRAVRLWLWPRRPMRVMQQFGANGRCTLYRIDFATPARRVGGTWYQTDAYLDLFATADGRDYAILDEDELAAAVERGIVASDLHACILAQLDELVDLLEADKFGGWLNEICSARFDLHVLPIAHTWSYQEFGPGEADSWPEGMD